MPRKEADLIKRVESNQIWRFEGNILEKKAQSLI